MIRIFVLVVVIIAASLTSMAQPVLITSPQTIGPADTTITASAGGPPVPLATAQVCVSGTTLTINGRHSLASLSVVDGGVVSHSRGFSYDYAETASDLVFGMHLILAGDCSTAAGTMITADGDGYGPNAGPSPTGACNETGGGGHGGRGGNGRGCSGGAVYGTAASPTTAGSGAYGGSCGSYGGGVIRLDVGGTLTIDGTISADGGAGQCNNGGGGGGSGGSVWISASSVQGGGAVFARGGAAADGNRGGGGGGRIAFYSETSDFKGTLSAFGGSGRQWGAAGTVYVRPSGTERDTLFIDNGGHSGARTEWLESPIIDASLMIRNNGRFSSGSNGFLELVVLGEMEIDSSSQVEVNHRGYGSNSGPGNSDDCNETGGAGHGGIGGAGRGCGSGASYGSATNPVTLGSGAYGGGCGSSGGGVIRLDVAGPITIDGTISSNGSNGQCNNGGGGGGSGGSIWLTASAVHGAGTVEAKGGAAADGNRGGGAGGRIAVYTCDHGLSSEQIVVSGGWGYRTGNEGTVHLSDLPADFAPPLGLLDAADLVAFIKLVDSENAEADFAQPFGEVNFFDLLAMLRIMNSHACD